ncbi:MAG TPA: 4a-hydroxytetrahydrobiopterin dehydratase [Polyangia bacterium]|nr:4a-hydroxytetrahydrobiopterin dehydratase [Polyangia bacterium]
MAASKDPPLSSRRCVPCEGGTPPLDDHASGNLLQQITGWSKRTAAGVNPGERHPEIHKRFQFADFLAAMAFVDRMGVLAEQEGHHPDFCVHYNQVDVTLWTHAVKGLSENDFILASKIDAIVP